MNNLTIKDFISDIQHLTIRYDNTAERNGHINKMIIQYYSHIKEECELYLKPKDTTGVHRTHCCVKHGCKYGDKCCPVVNNEVEQDYLCEECNIAGITRLSQLHETDYMNINRIDAIGNSCNFCNRGVISDNGINLKFPYKQVTSIETKGSGVSIRMCDDCIRELKEKTKKDII